MRRKCHVTWQGRKPPEPPLPAIEQTTSAKIWLMSKLADQTNRSANIGYLEQVAIRITKVKRHQRLRGTSPLHRTQKDRNMTGVKIRDNVLKWHRCQKAEVGRSR